MVSGIANGLDLGANRTAAKAPRAGWTDFQAALHSRRKGFRLIRDRLTYGRLIPWRTSKRELKQGRDITWTLRPMPAPEWVVEQWPGSAVRSHGICDGKPTDETRYYVSSLRTGAKALLRHIRDRCPIENSWHWVRDVPLREDAHRYRQGNGVRWHGQTMSYSARRTGEGLLKAEILRCLKRFIARETFHTLLGRPPVRTAVA